MRHRNIATGKVLSFSRHEQIAQPGGEDLIQKTLGRKENLLTGLELLRKAYEAALVAKSRRDVEAILLQVEALLKHPEKVNSPVRRISLRIRVEDKLRIGLWAIASRMARLWARSKRKVSNGHQGTGKCGLICFAADGAIRKIDRQH
jgi:hypothetical protein